MKDANNNRTRSRPAALTLTVGPGGQLQGTDDRALQAGADYLARLGGGILQVLPGTYQMRNSLFLHDHITLRGSGADTVLFKEAGTSTALTRETDWYEYGVRVQDPSLFRPGDGIMLRAYSEAGNLRDVVRDTVIAIDDDEITLHQRPEKNFWLDAKATAATLFPILTAAEGVCDVAVEDLFLDGNRDNNEEINGNYAGAVFLQQCHRYLFRHVTAQNYHGDGFSFQICDDVRFENCQSLGNANLGFHPGSGSQRPVFRDCVGDGNSQGLFFCWGVTDGRVEGGQFCDNTDYGISIGHRDTDNRIRGASFRGNHKTGLRFREPLHGYRGGHRNTIEQCEFVDNGFAEDGVAIDVCGLTHDTKIRGCHFDGNAGQARQQIGIRIGKDALRTKMAGNQFGGLTDDVIDLSNK